MMSVTGETTKAALSTAIVATQIAKYGLNFTSGLSKAYLGGAKNVADQLAPGIDLGIGKYLYEQAEKAANWGMDQAIKLQKFVRKQIR